MKKLEGKIAIVTGGSRDIGRSVSERLAEEGAKVVVNYCNSEPDAAATLAAILALGGTAIAVKATSRLEEIMRWAPFVFTVGSDGSGYGTNATKPR